VLDFTWVYENAAIARLNGTDPSAVVGRRLLDIFPSHKDTAFHAAYVQVAETGNPIVMEESFHGENMREEKWFRVAVARTGRDIAIWAQDITERKKTEEALRTAKTNLEETIAERTGELRLAYERLRTETEERLALEAGLRQAHKMEALGTLAGGIAHDFNNMLAAIIGNAEIALDEIFDEEIRSSLNSILSASERGADLIRQILAFSRKTERARNPFDMIRLLNETFKLLRSTIPKYIEMILNVTAAEAVVNADPTEIQQVVMNLANNAAYAMREEGGTMTVSLANRTLLQDHLLPDREMEPGDYVVVTVADTGTGMTVDVAERIFDPFFTTKGVGEGTGMGLAVVYGIVKKLRGGIAVETAPGKGSTFSVFLPRVCREELHETCDDPMPVSLGTEAVLFIDDEEAVTAMSHKTLQRLGYNVTSTTDPKEALALFLQDPSRFELVVTDQAMPGITGMKLAERMLEVRKDLPIILCTGYSDVASAEKAKAAGISTFLSKPYRKQVLAETVRQLLDGSKQQRKIEPMADPADGAPDITVTARLESDC
jgi:PAS domain S-box-containing protein